MTQNNFYSLLKKGGEYKLSNSDLFLKKEWKKNSIKNQCMSLSYFTWDQGFNGFRMSFIIVGKRWVLQTEYSRLIFTVNWKQNKIPIYNSSLLRVGFI